MRTAREATTAGWRTIDGVRSLVATVLLCALAAGCSSPPPPKPAMQTEKVEAPPPSEKKIVRLQVGGVVTFVVEAIATTADDPSLVRVFGQPANIAVVGKKVGKTTLHVQTKKEVVDVDVEVIAGEPATRALAIGETHPLSMKGVKEYSVGLPDIVTTAATTDGTQLLVTGRKPGSTTVLMIGRDGKHQTHEIIVVGGDRHL